MKSFNRVYLLSSHCYSKGKLENVNNETYAVQFRFIIEEQNKLGSEI